MTRNCTITKKASQWLSVECNVYDKECLRLYLRCEIINGSPDLTQVTRRGPITIKQYSFEISMFFAQVQKILAQSEYDKRVAEFELSFDF